MGTSCYLRQVGDEDSQEIILCIHDRCHEPAVGLTRVRMPDGFMDLMSQVLRSIKAAQLLCY